MKLPILLGAAVLFTGCSDRIRWIEDRRPETPEEREAVQGAVVAILAATPITTLEGHDQDWDDVIATAHRVAMETHCASRLYEWECTFDGMRVKMTGRWMPVQGGAK